MKKLFLLAAIAFGFMSCEIESDEPDWLQELAKVTDIEVPESFEIGKTYDIEVTYELPSACHVAQGVNASRESAYGSGRRKIFVAGVAAKKFGSPDCQQQGGDLLKKSSFKLLIDEDMPYTFYLWTGVDATGKGVYSEIEVPVLDTEPEVE